MMRSDINNDVVTLLDRYTIEDVMDKVIEYLHEKDVTNLKAWCKENLGTPVDISDGIDDHAIRALRFELDVVNARVERLEMRMITLCENIVGK